LLDKNNVSVYAPAAFEPEKHLIDILLTPTRIYVKPMLKAVQAKYVKACAHITGGGFQENIPRVFAKNVAAKVNLSAWKAPALFHYLKQLGNVQEYEMVFPIESVYYSLAFLVENIQLRYWNGGHRGS
jgi:phosphoribosylaminoimidazole (AIR) synthetase